MSCHVFVKDVLNPIELMLNVLCFDFLFENILKSEKFNIEWVSHFKKILKNCTCGVQYPCFPVGFAMCTFTKTLPKSIAESISVFSFLSVLLILCV